MVVNLNSAVDEEGGRIEESGPTGIRAAVSEGYISLVSCGPFERVIVPGHR